MVEPSSHFWTYLFIGVACFSLVVAVGGVVFLKLFVFRPAEKRAKRGLFGGDGYDPMKRDELIGLIRKLGSRSDENIVAREVAKNKFLLGFREELLTPIATIRDEAKRLQDRAAGERIEQASEGLGQLMGDIFELYTLEAGRAELSQERVSVQTLIDELALVFEGECAKTGNEIDFEVGPNVGSIVTDQDKFRCLVYNMISTSNSYTRNGKIAVHLSYASDGRLAIKVTDDGDGLPSSDETAWPGIKLPLTKKIAEFLGGNFRVRSNPPNGTEYSVVISIRPT